MVCASCNRAKSWTCETECPNWGWQDPDVCSTCMWAAPAGYEHIATRQRRQVTITWNDGDVASYLRLRQAALEAGEELPPYLRGLLDRQ